MKASVIFKMFATINFIALFTIFLLYRSGSLDSYFYKNSNNNFTSHNGGVSAKHIVDSIQGKIDSIHKLQRLRLSSSKSVIVYNDLDRSPRIDSTRVRPTDSEKQMMQRSKPEMMYSSKSGIIIEPKMFILDSLLKEKQKKQR